MLNTAFNYVSTFLFNPTIISLVVGYFNGIFTSFTMPSKLMDVVSIYLIFTIGYKGGACLGVANQCTPPLIMLCILGILIGFIQPFIHYKILVRTTNLNQPTAAVAAAEYGSISIITFITTVGFLEQQEILYDNFMSAIAGIMELPALFSGLFLLYYKKSSRYKNLLSQIAHMCKKIFLSPKLSFIFLGFGTGYLVRGYAFDTLNMALLKPFNLMVVLFMFDIGVKIAQQRSQILQFSPSLVAFALYMPLINGSLGLFIAQLLNTSHGSTVLFALLLASASYIAVPAVMSTQTSDAHEGIYLPMSLGITLPFNILFGIPFFNYIVGLIKSVADSF